MNLNSLSKLQNLFLNCVLTHCRALSCPGGKCLCIVPVSSLIWVFLKFPLENICSKISHSLQSTVLSRGGECLCIVPVSHLDSVEISIGKYIYPNCKMYFLNCKIYFPTHWSALSCPRGEWVCIVLVSHLDSVKFPSENIFIKIVKCICPNCKIYLSIHYLVPLSSSHRSSGFIETSVAKYLSKSMYQHFKMYLYKL